MTSNKLIKNVCVARSCSRKASKPPQISSGDCASSVLTENPTVETNWSSDSWLRYQTLLGYPSLTYFDAILARFLLTSLTHVWVFVIVTTGLVAFVGFQPIFDPIRVLNSLEMAMALGLGIGTLNCFLFSMVPIWVQAWNIITKSSFFISDVLFLFDSSPHPFDQYPIFNPLVHVVGEMRQGFYTNYEGSYVEPLFVYLGAFAAFAVGLPMLNQFNRTILNNPWKSTFQHRKTSGRTFWIFIKSRHKSGSLRPLLKFYSWFGPWSNTSKNSENEPWVWP